MTWSPAQVSDAAVAAAERARPHTGRTVRASLTAGESIVDLGGGVHARTFAYNGSVPGPTLRASVGDDLAVHVTNALARPTSMHWHGIALRNDMDGAAPRHPTSHPAASSPTASRFHTRAPTGPTRMSAATPTTAGTCR
ncbi:MAG: multicopper oxidase domain-containing protein [Gordonia sp. (in: high G+C Gram-positive bacteria)]